MRLIDADALADALFDKRKNYPQWVADTIGRMPDAVVRCKDCKYAKRMCQPWNDLVCEKNGQTNRPDFFCADGVKKDGQ